MEGKALGVQSLLRQYAPALKHLAEKGALLAQHRLDAFPQRLQNSVQTTTPHVERALQQTRMDYLVTLAECMANDPRQVLRNGYALLRPATMATTGDRLEVVTQAATYRVEVQGVEKGALLGDKTTGKSIRERMEEVW